MVQLGQSYYEIPGQNCNQRIFGTDRYIGSRRCSTQKSTRIHLGETFLRASEVMPLLARNIPGITQIDVLCMYDTMRMCSASHRNPVFTGETHIGIHTARITQSARHSLHHTVRVTQPISHIPHHTVRATQPASHIPHHTVRATQPASHSPHHTTRATRRTLHNPRNTGYATQPSLHRLPWTMGPHAPPALTSPPMCPISIYRHNMTINFSDEFQVHSLITSYQYTFIFHLRYIQYSHRNRSKYVLYITDWDIEVENTEYIWHNAKLHQYSALWILQETFTNSNKLITEI